MKTRWRNEEQMTTTTKPKRQADPDVMRLRAVKEAARKVAAAKRAITKAEDRHIRATTELEHLLTEAPQAQQGYLRSIAGLPPA